MGRNPSLSMHRQRGFVYNYSVCRKAVSISVIGRVPIILSIAASAMVARLSVITTESVRSPDRCPMGVDTSITHTARMVGTKQAAGDHRYDDLGQSGL